jgi:hypothetical protein
MISFYYYSMFTLRIKLIIINLFSKKRKKITYLINLLIKLHLIINFYYFKKHILIK